MTLPGWGGSVFPMQMFQGVCVGFPALRAGVRSAFFFWKCQMTDSQALKQLFPPEGTVPQEHRLPARIHQRTYLVGGRLQAWDGPCKAVLSPVCTTLADGTVRQVPIGSYPEMGVEQSDAALDAAVAAYDSGRGLWPTMTVAERIACMQAFVKGMLERRQAIVSLI